MAEMFVKCVLMEIYGAHLPSRMTSSILDVLWELFALLHGKLAPVRYSRPGSGISHFA